MAESVKVRAEGFVFSVKKGTLLSEIIPRLKLSKEPLFARIDGQLAGLETPLEKDTEVRLVYEGSDDALDALRHSSAHLMAHAVLELFPNTQTGIGPAVEDGFFYDFLRDKPFTPDDLQRIEEKMRELAKKDIPIQRLTLSKKEALRIFREMGQKLKVELIEEKGGKEVTCYKQDGFIDFCLGPHLPSTGRIKHFKLLSVSGAYWKGDEKGIQLQRIYGTSFFSGKEGSQKARARARPFQFQRGYGSRTDPLASQGSHYQAHH